MTAQPILLKGFIRHLGILFVSLILYNWPHISFWNMAVAVLLSIPLICILTMARPP